MPQVTSAPWTAVFIDKIVISNIGRPSIKFLDTVAPRLDKLQTFSLHFPNDRVITVNLIEGVFYIGTPDNRIAPVASVVGLKKSLLYSRHCGAAMSGGKPMSIVTGYMLGWESGPVKCIAQISPDGAITTWEIQG